MDTLVKIYQTDYEAFATDQSITENLEPDNLCFYQFSGGNANETDDLINQLDALKEKKALLIGIFRFPFRFEGKKRFQTASSQYFRMKELCDAVIYFHSDALMESIDKYTTIREANQTFHAIEEHTIHTMKQLIERTGDMNIDFQDIEAFINKNKGPLFLHTVEGETFDEPLKDLISTPYLPDDFADGRQLMLNIGYARDVDMEAYRQINLRLHDLFSKADLFKIGTYFMDEPGQHFNITLLVNGIRDPIDTPDDFKKLSKYRTLFRKWQGLTKKGRLFS
ncbi:cell division protein FtsZ [Virgibacillus doumboii]|uniref:cell division protein FtsZ n=1 Tax=Virgibacillus doumboii TaxID=2697503 RepID=UPI0013DE8889|nr:cell division protein FtsZ [Virgibacillus doumboii]